MGPKFSKKKRKNKSKTNYSEEISNPKTQDLLLPIDSRVFTTSLEQGLAAGSVAVHWRAKFIISTISF